MSVAYQAHFFDFDHTLFDSDASEALAFDHAMTSQGVAPTPALFATYRRINSALWKLVEGGGISPSEVKIRRFAELVIDASLDVDPISMADAFTIGMQESGELYPGAADVVTRVREHGPVALVTNAISEIQRRRIERLDIGSLFDTIVISSEVGVAKPAPEIFDLAFARLGPVDRADTLMVGDSLSSDMAGGFAAGLATCWFNPNGSVRSADLVPDHEITSLELLLEL